MVGHEQDRGLLVGGFEDVEELADLFIQIGNIGEVGPTRIANVIFGDVEAAPVVRVEDAL